LATGGTVTNPAPGAYTYHTFTGAGTFACSPYSVTSNTGYNIN
jgi:hypothetical protein